jgi:hypothetical protein
MKFISIFTVDPSAQTEPPDAKMYEKMGALIQELTTSGQMIDTGGVAPTGVSMRVRRHGTQTTVTDGPFTESKEIVGGFALLNVQSKAEAIAVTQRFLDLTGSGTCQLHELAEM